jgi:hypothetical protein
VCVREKGTVGECSGRLSHGRGGRRVLQRGREAGKREDKGAVRVGG